MGWVRIALTYKFVFGSLVIAGFAEYLVVEYGELVGADDESTWGFCRHRFCFLAGQIASEFGRRQPLFIAFVHLR